jgi:hypothetical protein
LDGSKHDGEPRRLICPQPIAAVGGEAASSETMLARLEPGVVFMMGDNPALAKMPEKPRLLDFFRLRLNYICRTLFLLCSKMAMLAGMVPG